MKQALVLVTLLILLGFTSILLVFMPYHFFYVALESGIESRFLTTNKVESSFLSGNEMIIAENKDTTESERKRWKTFHIGNYLLPLPVRHPYFLMIPDIALEKDKSVKIAWELQNQNLKQESRVELLRPIDYQYPFEDNLLFNLPLFKNHLLQVSDDKIWRDLFTLDIRLPENKDLSFMEWVQGLWRIPYTELSYRLFILKTRQALFPKETKLISYARVKNMGVVEVEVPSDGTNLVDNNLRTEQFMLLQDGKIHRLQLTTRRFGNISKSYRERVVRELEWKLSNPDETVAINNAFNQSSFERKIDQEGMTYLFAGWSHVPKKEDFLRTMIQFLERGIKNSAHLRSLYNYAYDLFGTTFSTIKENLRETEQRRLERKISEEAKGEFNRLEQTQIAAPDANFANEKEQVDTFLKNAKESGIEVEENVLSN